MKALLLGLCLFTVIMKIFRHTQKCREQKDPRLPCTHHSASPVICFICPPPTTAPAAPPYIFFGGGRSRIYFKANPKQHIIPCSPNTLVYTSKKKEEQEEEGKKKMQKKEKR